MERVYEFTGPYNTLTTKKKLERLPDRDIKEMLDAEIDVYQLIYKPYGLTQEDLSEDLKEKIGIAVFRNQSGEYLSLPTRYVKYDINELDNVDYTGRGIVIDLGALPSNENIDDVLEDIKIYIEHRLGIKPIVNEIKTSETSIDLEEHNTYEAGRELLKTDEDNYYLSLLKCKEEKETLLTYIEEVDECAIAEHCDCD